MTGNEPHDPAGATPPSPQSGSFASGPEPAPPPPPSYPGAPPNRSESPPAYPGSYPTAPPPYPGYPYPGAPQPGQPYPGPPQAYPAGPGYPNGTFPPPPLPPGGPPSGRAAQPGGPRRSRVPLVLAGSVGVLVLGLVITFAMLTGNRAGAPGGSPTGGTIPTGAAGTATALAPPQAAEAHLAVQGYLEALAVGDAAAALSYAAVPPLDTGLLTDGMLATSLARAPITDITTTPGSGVDQQSVRADFRIGPDEVTSVFAVTLVSGTWLLEDVATPLPLDLTGAEGIALTINGVPFTGTSPVVFPGSYTVATAEPRYKVSGGTVVVEGTAEAGRRPAVTARLSAAGIAEIRKAAQRKLTACLGKKSLTPKGCGFNTWLPGNNKVRAATIDWDVVSGSRAMTRLKPVLATPGSATAAVSVRTRVYCSSTNGLRWRGFSSVSTVHADLSGGSVSIIFNP